MNSNTNTHGVKPYELKKDEAYMNKNQRQHFLEILTNWKNLLMEEVDLTVHLMQEESTNLADPNDRATQEEAFTVTLRTRDRERKLLSNIERALKQLVEDEYGYCGVCELDIGVRRLEARPTTTRCIDCKTLDEVREKHTR